MLAPFSAETCCKQILIHIIDIFSFNWLGFLCYVRVTVYLSVETLGINAVTIYKFMFSFIEFLYCLEQSNTDVCFILFWGGCILLLLYIVNVTDGRRNRYMRTVEWRVW